MISVFQEISLGLKKLSLMAKNRNNKARCQILDLAMDYARCAKVQGDYFEFGVYRGLTFQYAYHSAQLRNLHQMRFHAFDSFEGFAEPRTNETTGVITKGKRSASRQEFIQILRSFRVDRAKINVFPGWFEETLVGPGAAETAATLGTSQAAIVYLDADLYDPTLLSLEFITDYLVDGSLLLFDNWFLLRGHPARGERRAFDEWRNKHPDLIITDYNNFGWHGKSFLVNLPHSQP